MISKIYLRFQLCMMAVRMAAPDITAGSSVPRVVSHSANITHRKGKIVALSSNLSDVLQ